jgi:cobalt-zinc-cadmium efflux system protein
VAPGRDCHAVRAAIEGLLRREYDLKHSTLQVDHAGLEGPADPHCDDAHGAAYRARI